MWEFKHIQCNLSLFFPFVCFEMSHFSPSSKSAIYIHNLCAIIPFLFTCELIGQDFLSYEYAYSVFKSQKRRCVLILLTVIALCHLWSWPLSGTVRTHEDRGGAFKLLPNKLDGISGRSYWRQKGTLSASACGWSGEVTKYL